MQWPADASAVQADVGVLLEIAGVQPNLIDEDVVAAMLKNRSFIAPLDGLTLRLLGFCRAQTRL